MQNKSEYFVIDSEHIGSVCTSLYGWYLTKDLFSSDVPDPDEQPIEGAFIYIKRDGTKISITQDWLGSYGLYCFRKDAYFAISNSFIMLVDYLKTKHTLSFNRDYANYLLSGPMVPLTYSETMINEISLLDRRAEIIINTETLQFGIALRDYEEYTIELNSEEAFQIIDNWYESWINRLKSLKSLTSNISVDLSGGFDSRLTFMLFLKSGIYDENIRVRSISDKLHTHSEDYEISLQIADRFNIKLNKGSVLSDTVPRSTQDIINGSLYPKFCYHTQMYYRYSLNTKPFIHISGLGGELIRNYWTMSQDEFTDTEAKRSAKHSENAKEFEQSIRRILSTTYKNVIDVEASFGREIPEDLITLMLYRDTRTRYQIARGRVEAFSANEILLCPITDPNLIKLRFKTEECFDDYLLMTVLFDRYLPELLDFKIEGKRKIKESTIQYAHFLNKKYPYHEKASSFCNECRGQRTLAPFEIDFNSAKPVSKVSASVINGTIKKAFLSHDTRRVFNSQYNDRIYQRIENEINTLKYFPLSRAHIVLSICKILQDVELSKIIANDSPATFVISKANNLNVANDRTLINTHSNLDPLLTLRIDLVNRGSEKCDCEISNCSDYNSIIKTPDWMKKSNGSGRIISSKTGLLFLEIRCIEQGTLVMSFRGMDIRRKSGKRIPYWIDVKRIVIDNQEILNETEPVWHDKAFHFEKPVMDGQTVQLFVAWEPHNERKNPTIID